MSLIKVKGLPLYTDPDYNYDINLNGVSYNLRMVYAERNESWYISLKEQEAEDYEIENIRLSRDSPIYHKQGESYFFLSTVGGSSEVDRDNFRIDKWCKLYYVYLEDE